MTSSIKKSIQEFPTISLEEMKSVALLKRTDTKFILNKADLQPTLNQIAKSYRVLEVEGNRFMNYASLYFDTPNKKFYHDHHNGKVNRTKIRMRKYLDSNLCFLEVKQKNGKGQTNKTRIEIPDFETHLSTFNNSFIKNTTQNIYNLTPTLWSHFTRITLVNIEEEERITIDLNLEFSIDNQNMNYNDLVIVELKQKRFDRSSKLIEVLKKKAIHPYSISKYCMGMAQLYSSLKSNLFKQKLLRINKILA